MVCREGTKRVPCFAVLAAVVLMGCTGQVLPREQLEREWVQRMIKAQAGTITFSDASATPRVSQNTQTVFATSGENTMRIEKGIQVLDLRRSYLWGFFGTGLSEGGGWQLRGGPLTTTVVPGRGVLELEILQVIRWHPGMFPFWGNHYRRSDVSYKVFLLDRKESTELSSILSRGRFRRRMFNGLPPASGT
jgi:hypothetical protein